MKKQQQPSSSSKAVVTVLPCQTPLLRDHYSLKKKLGQGQFGTTYLCTHKATSWLFACKSIPKRKLLCQEDYDDVWREIQIIHHFSEYPNVVQIKGTYEDNMFERKGGELFDRVIQKGYFSKREAIKLIKTTVGVMHRDLKPKNFLFERKDEG